MTTYITFRRQIDGQVSLNSRRANDLGASRGKFELVKISINQLADVT